MGDLLLIPGSAILSVSIMGLSFHAAVVPFTLEAQVAAALIGAVFGLLLIAIKKGNPDA